jgi:hypothetical protein
VLYASGLFPKLKAFNQGLMWKGKHFTPTGMMNNRWPLGIETRGAITTLGPSALDGLPCAIIDYPSNDLIFPNVRDELREVSPGVWLGRNYKRDGDGFIWKGYFLLKE